MPWGATAAEVEEALESLQTVTNVEVMRSGDETSAAFHFGYVYTIRFWGTYLGASSLPLVEFLFAAQVEADKSDFFAASGGAWGVGGDVSAHIHAVAQGAAEASGSSSFTYTALQRGATYFVRSKAVNREGASAYSEALAVTTAAEPVVPSAPTAVSLAACGYSPTSLVLTFAPPLQTGGARISHYKVEWSTDAVFKPSGTFDFGGDASSASVGSAALEVVHEVQSVVVDFRSGDDILRRAGTFSLRWGGASTAPLPYDVSAMDLAVAVQGISGWLEGVGDIGDAVTATRQPKRHGFQWDVTFKGRRGDLGLLVADGTRLYGDDATVDVIEKQPGRADIVPGSFTFEEQSIAVVADSRAGGTFRLSFEGKETVDIEFDESRETFKQKLEAIPSIHVASVRRYVTSQRLQLVTWHVTFAYLKHETVVGAGDVGLFLATATSDLSGNQARVEVTEMVKGTAPLRFTIDGLEPGKDVFARVSAQNSAGFGAASAATKGAPRGPPAAPARVALGVAGGSALDLSWAAPHLDTAHLTTYFSTEAARAEAAASAKEATLAASNGAPLTGYRVEWFRKPGKAESQIITTSADRGVSFTALLPLLVPFRNA